MAISLIIDPGAQPLDLLAAPVRVLGYRMPSPQPDRRFAQPQDADGDRLVASRYLNRDILISVEIKPTDRSAAARSTTAQVALAQLAEKVAKIEREGGELQYTLPSGDTIYFDLLAADQIDPPRDLDWDLVQVERVELRFIAKPFWRKAEMAIVSDGRGGYVWGATGSAATISERTLPVLSFVVPGVPYGDVPAAGRLVLTDDQGADQAWAVWGLQSANYDSASTAALYYAASALTAYSGTLTTSAFKAILSTQAIGGGAHMTHVGAFRVFARIRRGSGAGTFTLALDWATGDMLSHVRNAASTYAPGDASTAERIFDLGIVDIPPVLQGAQQWEGRIVSMSTVVGDTAPTPTSLWLVPIAESSGEATATTRSPAPTTFAAVDGFDQAAGALTGKGLPTGGTWIGAGASATDYDVTSYSGVTYASRTARDATTNFASGRIVAASTPTGMTGTLVKADGLFWIDYANGAMQGITLRYTDANNFLAVVLRTVGTQAELALLSRVASVDAVLATTALPSTVYDPMNRWFYMGAWSITAALSAGGVLTASCTGVLLGGLNASASLSYYSTVLGTGGTLARGTVGLLSRAIGNASTAGGGQVVSIEASALVSDAVIYARQSAEFRYDGAVREDSTGAAWGGINSYEGDMLTIPPAGPERRSARIAVKASRTIPGTGLDPATDDLAAQLFATPRGLIVP